MDGLSQLFMHSWVCPTQLYLVDRKINSCSLGSLMSKWGAVVTCTVVTHQYPSKIVSETIFIFRLDMMMWSPWPSRPSGSTPWIWEAPWSGALRLMTSGETMGTNILWSPQSRGSWTGDKYFLVSSCKTFSKVEKLLILILFLEKMMHVKLHQAAGEATFYCYTFLCHRIMINWLNCFINSFQYSVFGFFNCIVKCHHLYLN